MTPPYKFGLQLEGEPLVIGAYHSDYLPAIGHKIDLSLGAVDKQQTFTPNPLSPNAGKFKRFEVVDYIHRPEAGQIVLMVRPYQARRISETLGRPGEHRVSEQLTAILDTPLPPQKSISEIMAEKDIVERLSNSPTLKVSPRHGILTEEQLADLCDDELSIDVDVTDLPAIPPNGRRFGTIHWGRSSDHQPQTHLIIWEMEHDPFEQLRLRLFTVIEIIGNGNPKDTIKSLVGCCKRFDVSAVAADWGSGMALNHWLEQEAADQGIPLKVLRIMYVTADGGTVDDTGILRVVRNDAITDAMGAMLNKRMRFPCWDEFSHYAPDILSIQVEMREGLTHYIETKNVEMLHHIIYAQALLKSEWEITL